MAKSRRTKRRAAQATRKKSLPEILLEPLPKADPQENPQEKEPKASPWPGICNALGTEFREETEIHGQSGLTHPIAGLGIDERNKRLIVVSADHNPRVAALMRMDVQASLPDLKVMVARPIAVDIPFLIRKNFYGAGGELSIPKVLKLAQSLSDNGTMKARTGTFSDSIDLFMSNMGRSDLPIRTHLHNLIEQMSTVGFPDLSKEEAPTLLDLATGFMNGFARIDNLSADLNNGLCPIPTYEFCEEDWELLLSGTRPDDIKQLLHEKRIFQYFFPSKDELSLGLIDRGASSIDEIELGIKRSETEGHILSGNAILDNAADIQDIINEFKSQRIITEGEMNWEVTRDGNKIRNSVKFRPSEGLISRVSKIFALRIDISLGSLFGK